MMTVGFDVGTHPWAGQIIEDDDNEAPPLAP
jgi:hypothetical protein